MRPAILHARVMHNRTLPRNNRFCYGVYYLAIPLDAIEDGSLNTWLPLNRFGLHSLYTRDHGYRDGGSLRRWVEDMLSGYDVPRPEAITLVCMPRVLGYVFNPVSFWLCRDGRDNTYAIICEVNNTFGETHSYVCIRPQRRPVDTGGWIVAPKCFHVSPYLKREGHYRFRFDITAERCAIRIDYINAEQQTTLITSLCGRFADLSATELLKAFFSNPLVTVKTISMIHFQALRLTLKGIRYISKPPAVTPNVTCADVSADATSPEQKTEANSAPS